MQKVLLRQNKLHRQKEYFWVIVVNTINDILYVELIAIGSLDRVQFRSHDNTFFEGLISPETFTNKTQTAACPSSEEQTGNFSPIDNGTVLRG